MYSKLVSSRLIIVISLAKLQSVISFVLSLFRGFLISQGNLLS